MPRYSPRAYAHRARPATGFDRGGHNHGWARAGRYRAYHQFVRVTGSARQAALDGALAAFLVAASLLLARQEFFPTVNLTEKYATLLGSPDGLRQHLTWWWIATAAAVVALLLRTYAPVPAFALAAAAALAHAADLNLRLLGLAMLPIDLAAVIVLVTVAGTARARRAGVIALAAAIAAHAAVLAAAILSGTQPMPVVRAALLSDPSSPVGVATAALSLTATPALLLGIAWAVGDNLRTQRIHRAASDQRAAAVERARITRELHDVVAHGMSVMVVQAAAAQASLRSQPGTAEAALDHVIDTGRASLTEMRRVLSLVRTPAILTPEPGIAALPELIDQVRGAGTPVVLHVDGDVGRLPAAVDLSAYRIIQEALTNVRRHAGPGAHATIRLARTDLQLDIDVSDDGATTGVNHAPGHGLRGIAERVSALGGAMTARPRESGGFSLHVTLPTLAVAP